MRQASLILSSRVLLESVILKVKGPVCFGSLDIPQSEKLSTGSGDIVTYRKMLAGCVDRR